MSGRVESLSSRIHLKVHPHSSDIRNVRERNLVQYIKYGGETDPLPIKTGYCFFPSSRPVSVLGAANKEGETSRKGMMSLNFRT